MTKEATKRETVLEVKNPAWLIARADVDNARQHLKRCRGNVWEAHRQNEEHATEIAGLLRSSTPILTAQQVLIRGGGSGVQCCYRRCTHEGREDCLHDPQEAPFSDQHLDALAAVVDTAEQAFIEAEAALMDTDSQFDAAAAAREQGRQFVWWTLDPNRDPRLYRWRGQPLTDLDLEQLGPRELARYLNVGGIVDIS